MFSRRTVVETLASIPLLGAALPVRAGSSKKKKRVPDYLKDLGVKPFINAAGTYTALTASVMPEEVLDAMRYASSHYVHLTKLQDAVGARIATLTGAEAAMVTSGAAGALLVGTAACITGRDPDKIRRIPDLTGMKNEVLVQKRHRYAYDHSVRTTGVRMVEIETAEELERAIGPETVSMHFYCDAEPRGQISAADWTALGKKHGVPTFADAADVLPPVDNLSRYLKLGFDLVCFSGGKGIRGPQSAGLLLGRKDLIEAARLNTSPNSDTIARSNKVNKEEMLGMMVALELYMKRDHAADWREWERRTETIARAVKKVKSVETEVHVPPVANHVPHLKIRWDANVVRVTPLEVKRRLAEGDPAIEACPGTNSRELVFGVWMMQPGDAEIVARRVAGILKSAV
ncbi:MAG: selenocysteine synthase [Acidobacteriales bacterium]|nr:selenocysteine synthase [Terriglobales bacterium]